MDVLILEDDVTLSEVFRDALEDAGHSVTIAYRNAEAIAILGNQAFDLLIVDLMIAGETSIPVLDFANYARPDAEIILVTGSGLFPRGEMHYAISGVSYRVQKPVNLNDLVHLVAHFERTKLKPDISAQSPGSGQLSA